MGGDGHSLYVNSSQAQTTWVVLLFVFVLGCLAFGVVGLSSAQSTAAAQLTAAGSGDVQEARAGFLGWGALGALIAVTSMRWVRRSSEDESDPS